MSPIKEMIVGLFLLAVLLLSIGCGTSDPNSAAPFDSNSGQHGANWLPAGHAQVAQADPAACTECHGSDLSGGISKVSCTPCHLNGSPFVLTNCTSCHGNPPTANVVPNRAGAHAAHNVLPNVKNVCNSCHSGAGSGTLNHDNGTVDVVFLNSYNAKSGTATYDAAGSTCSKVSCHGGQTTPGWLAGVTIDVNTQCTSCHAFGTTEFNSFSSGQHDFHVNTEHFPCDRCHDNLNLSVNHFTSLNTPVMEGPASASLLSTLTYTNGTCTPLCHGLRSW